MREMIQLVAAFGFCCLPFWLVFKVVGREGVIVLLWVFGGFLVLAGLYGNKIKTSQVEMRLLDE